MNIVNKVILEKGESMTHPVLQWARATPDFVRTNADGSKINVEVKCPSGLAFEGYRDSHEYYAQCQWQMFVTGIPLTHFVVFNGMTGTVEILHEWEEDKDVQLHLVKKAHAFLNDNLIPEIEPPITGSQGCSEALLHKFPKSKSLDLVEATENNEKWIRAYLEAKHESVDVKARLDLAANNLKDAIGDEAGMISEFGKVYWKTASRNTVDWKSLAIELDIDESLIDKFTTNKQYRTFRPFLKGEF